MQNYNALFGCTHCSVQQEHRDEGTNKKKKTKETKTKTKTKKKLRFPAVPGMEAKGTVRTVEQVLRSVQHMMDSVSGGERMEHYEGIKDVSPLFQVSNDQLESAKLTS
jgi:hypothetical protein